MNISRSDARRMAIRAQGLDGGLRRPEGREGAAQVIEHLGHVQIDTIAVVERAHHHTIWSRHSGYEPSMLDALLATDRRVFEYWLGHVACYLPMRDYRFSLPRMKSTAEGQNTREWLDERPIIAGDILKRIRAEGPLGSADFDALPGTKRGSWWAWKPAKRALELLFSMGELMITERRNFQRIYDLTERVLTPDTDTTVPSSEELARFGVRTGLASRGVADSRSICPRLVGQPLISATLDELMAAREVVALEVEDVDGPTYYAMAQAVEDAATSGAVPETVHILSPFDNLVRMRGRLGHLYDFDYKLECYMPAAKRRYGYFCLPILWGDRFIGRLDPKADRKRRTLILRSVMFEPGFQECEAIMPALAEKLRAFARFNECDRIEVEAVAPKSLKKPMERELNNASIRD